MLRLTHIPNKFTVQVVVVVAEVVELVFVEEEEMVVERVLGEIVVERVLEGMAEERELEGSTELVDEGVLDGCIVVVEVAELVVMTELDELVELVELA